MVKIDSEGKEVRGSKQTELIKMFSQAGLVAVAFRKALAVLLRTASATHLVQLSLRSCLLAPGPEAGAALEDTGQGWGMWRERKISSEVWRPWIESTPLVWGLDRVSHSSKLARLWHTAGETAWGPQDSCATEVFLRGGEKDTERVRKNRSSQAKGKAPFSFT